MGFNNPAFVDDDNQPASTKSNIELTAKNASNTTESSTSPTSTVIKHK